MKCHAMQELERPEAMYKALGAKMVVGLPFKDIATSDSLLMRALPPSSDANGQRALRRLQVMQSSRCSVSPSSPSSSVSSHYLLRLETVGPGVFLALLIVSKSSKAMKTLTLLRANRRWECTSLRQQQV